MASLGEQSGDLIELGYLNHLERNFALSSTEPFSPWYLLCNVRNIVKQRLLLSRKLVFLVIKAKQIIYD